MPYPFDQIFAADPDNTDMIAKNAPVVVFAPGDETKTPLPLTTLNGLPLENPIIVNDRGFGPAFIADLDQVAWEGGGLTGLMASYKGLKDEAVAARAAAEAAAAAAQAPTDDAVDRAVSRAMPSIVTAVVNQLPNTQELPAGGMFARYKNGNTWPNRGTDRTDITVVWVGPEPSPAAVSSGTGGMRANDLRFVTP